MLSCDPTLATSRSITLMYCSTSRRRCAPPQHERFLYNGFTLQSLPAAEGILRFRGDPSAQAGKT